MLEYNKIVEQQKSKDVSTQTDQEIFKKIKIKQDKLEKIKNRKCKECGQKVSKKSSGFCFKCSRKIVEKLKIDHLRKFF